MHRRARGRGMPPKRAQDQLGGLPGWTAPCFAKGRWEPDHREPQSFADRKGNSHYLLEVNLLDPGQRAPTMGEARAPSHFATSILALLVPQHRNTQHCTEGGPVFGIQVLEGSSGIAGNTTNRHRKGRCSGYVTRPPQCRPPFL